MKKVNLILTAAILLFAMVATNIQAQDATFGKGVKVVNLGLGLGSTLGGYGYATEIPPISVSLDWGIIDELFNVENLSLGVGGYLGYSSNKWTWSGADYGWRYTYVIPGVRGTVHYQLPVEKLDTYAGLMLGYNIVTHKEFGTWAGANTYSASASTAEFSAYAGARYYFTNSIAAFAELGYGIAYLNIGLSLKF